MPNPKQQSYKERVIEEFRNSPMIIPLEDDPEIRGIAKDIEDFISQALKYQMKEVTDLIASQVGFLKMRGQDYYQLQELYENLKQAGLI